MVHTHIFIAFSIHHLIEHKICELSYKLILGITYVIENLIPDTAYLIRVASLNRSGLSDWMGPKEFRTHIAAVPTTGSKATTLAISSHTIIMCFVHLIFVGIAYERLNA